jgi:hypothetical protein
MAERHKASLLIAILAAGPLAVSLQGCTKSAEEKARYVSAMSAELDQQFRVNDDGVRTLGDELAASDFDSVQLLADSSVRALIYDGITFNETVVEDPALWRNLLNDAEVDYAYKSGSGITLMKSLKPPYVFGDSGYEYQFISSAYDLSQSCLPRHFESECGACIEPLDDEWHLLVSWLPTSWVDELEAGEPISKFRSRIDACLAQLSDQN